VDPSDDNTDFNPKENFLFKKEKSVEGKIDRIFNG
jgi:hypothetical protein